MVKKTKKKIKKKKFVCEVCGGEFSSERGLSIHKGLKHKKVEVEEKPKEEVEAPIGWIPKTSLGKSVMRGEIKDIDEILDKGIKIRESAIVDTLIPNLENELVFIGGRPGKGGGIERTPVRITAKMHRSGRRFGMKAFAIVGNKDGIVGVGKGKGEDSRSAIGKAIKNAKLDIIKVLRGCGSWECECGEPHSIPFKTEGKSGSVRVILMPAPKGIGLAIDDESKKILRLAGIKDIWSQIFGDTGTRFNLIKAVFNALANLHTYRTG